jgi:hypothetical protein
LQRIHQGNDLVVLGHGVEWGHAPLSPGPKESYRQHEFLLKRAPGNFWRPPGRSLSNSHIALWQNTRQLPDGVGGTIVEPAGVSGLQEKN